MLRAGLGRGTTGLSVTESVGGTRPAVSIKTRAAPRPAALTPARGSLPAAAVNEIRRPPAIAQGATVAQIHLIRERRDRSRTLPHPVRYHRNGPLQGGVRLVS